MRHPLVYAFLASVLLVACGGGDDESEQLCEDVRAKVSECNLNINTSGQCQSNPSKAVVCTARCLVNAECAQITGAVPNNPYYRCVAECSGAGPNDFICFNGTGFVREAGVCDGTNQCTDGSDEANCPP